MGHKDKVDAVERGVELLKVKRSQLPEKACRFCDFMCQKYMMCIEVCLTAFAVYAQFEEGAVTDNDLYNARTNSVAKRDWDVCFGT